MLDGWREGRSVICGGGGGGGAGDTGNNPSYDMTDTVAVVSWESRKICFNKLYIHDISLYR